MTAPGWGIKPLRATRLPHSTVVLATLPELHGDKDGYSETWRCAVARFERHGPRRMPVCVYRPYEDPGTLWTDVTRHCGAEGVTFLWTWDLGRVARTTTMLTSLPGQGWRLDVFNLNPGASWMVWKRGAATLKMADLFSVWPSSVDAVATLFGTGRRLPERWDAPFLSWLAAARRDCEILATALDEYMAWIDAEDLGSLAVTGNGQAWSAFRRRFMSHGIQVHQDDDAREMERAAMWTGRAEALWHGSIGFAVVHEWDMHAAHTRIAHQCALPTWLHAPIDPRRPIESYLDDERYAVLAEVEVETDVPCTPTFHDEGMVWPVGRFPSVLWDPEIRAVIDGGGRVRVGRGWLYRRAPSLHDWGSWVLSGLESNDDSVPAWRKAILKRWGNVLIGRFAMQYPQWTLTAWSPEPDVRSTPCLDEDTGEEYTIMQVGHDVFFQSGLTEAGNTAPMVTGYVMSEQRARLWRLMSAVPEHALLYVDTDSLLVTDRWLPEMTALAARWPQYGLRLKRSWTGLSIYGPRQIVTGDRVRVSGLPTGAQRVGRHEWEGEVTESLPEALARGRVAEVAMTPRAWSLHGHDPRRAGSDYGWTRPHTLPRPGETL